MEVILLENIGNLGGLGDKVSVKPGYGRNYLLPQGKALRASEANKARFEAEKAQLEARNLETKAEAEKLGVPLLAEIPLHLDIRKAADGGAPIVVSKPESAQASAFRSVARQLIADGNA